MTNNAATTAPSSTTTRGEQRSDVNRFETAPFYRKRWMVLVSALVFIPVTLIILLSGPVFQNDGEVWDQKHRYMTAGALVAFMVFTFLRLSVQPS